MKQVAAVRVRLCVIVVFAICLSTIATAQYVPNPRDLGAYRFLLDDGTGSGFFGIIRLNAPLTNHIFYDFPATASGSFIFSNSSGGQSIAGGLAVSGGLNADVLTLTTPLAATSGGTGYGSYAVGDLLYANSITSLSRLPIGSNGQILTISGGSPTWSNTAGGLLLPFSQITNGTNTGQANLEIGNGSAIYPVGTGAITANRFVTSTSLTDNVDLATSEVSGVLPDANVSNTLTITGGSIDGTPIGGTTRSTGSFTVLDANGAVTLGNGNDNITLNAGSGIISMSGDKVENVANPTAAQDAATKNYVDNGFVRLGPNPSQAYTGTQPLIRLDETGASAPSLMDLRVGGTAQLVVTNAGALTATSIQNTPIGSTTRSTGSFTVLDANGNVTLGNAAADVITVNGTSTFASPVTANGAVTLGSGNDNITLNAGSGIISMSGDKLENVANPTAAQDAATKNYVDNTALGGVVGPFVQLGPAALQAYTGTNPLIRLDETGGGTPNLMDLRVGGVVQLVVTNAGALTATSIQNTPIGSTTRSTGSFTVLDANGAVTLGNGNDNITLNAGSGIISMSGDKLENVADPTAAQDAATKNYVDNGFVRLGPNPSQAYTGTQPLIRLDETGASAPSLMDLRVGGTAQLVVTNAGALTATSIQNTPIGSTTRSTGSFTVLDANGAVTLGDAAADVITVNGTSTFASPVTANGAVTLGNGNDNITLNAGSGIISMSGDKVENVANPTAAQDAATKNYVDNTALGGVVGPFVQLGPAALQAYTGTNPLIRLDETGGGTPNLMDLRVGGTAQLVVTNAGALTATSIQNTPIGSTTRSTGSFTVLDANGAVTLGNGNDNITLNAGSGIISMSGDKLENVADPTAAQDAATKNYVDNGFVRLGPNPSQAYTGTQPLIRLDETGASAPSLMDLRVGGTAQLVVTNAGALTATSIQNTPIGSTTRSTGSFTVLDANGAVTLGDAAADVITVNGTSTFASPVTANGAVTLGNGNDNITLNAGSGIISMSGDKLENVANPTAAQDAATKTYVDNTALGGVVGPFVQLGPAALQAYTGTNPLIRLDETGGGTPNLMDLRVGGTAQLVVTNAGALTATSIQNTPIGSTTRSTGSFTVLDANGAVTLGDAAADVITVNGTSTFASPVTANGAVTLGNGNDNITLNAGSGIISMSGDKVENVANPTAAQDAATKNYVDNGFVQIGPAASQSYTGANPVIRLDETGASAPSLMDLRVGGTAQLVVTNAGALTATSIQNTPIGSTTRSTGSFTVLDANGAVTLGDAAADVITVNGTSTFASPVTANGAVTLGNGNDNITLNAGSGIISMSGDKLENVANPTAAQDAATKNYVDNGFVQIGPAASQSYTGANPVIRLDETGASAPSLVDLRVGGTATFTVTNNGTVRVGTTTSATNSRLTVRDGHVQSQQTTAPITGTLGAGVTSAVLSNATDVAGVINITTNGTPATGAQATVTFNLPYGTAPIIVLSPANNNASGITVHTTRNTAGFTINFNAVPAASTSYQFYYHVIETQ